MSSFKHRRAFMVVSALAFAVFGLGACGFEPLHKQGSASSGSALAGVEIDRVPDRSGQLLRNELLNLMAPRGAASVQPWELKVTLSESISEVLLEETAFATRADVTVTASATLVRKSDNEVIGVASSKAVGSYNILSATQEYANVVGERDAREDAIRLVARDIVRLVSVWLRNAEDDPV